MIDLGKQLYGEFDTSTFVLAGALTGTNQEFIMMLVKSTPLGNMYGRTENIRLQIERLTFYDESR